VLEATRLGGPEGAAHGGLPGGERARGVDDVGVGIGRGELGGEEGGRDVRCALVGGMCQRWDDGEGCFSGGMMERASRGPKRWTDERSASLPLFPNVSRFPLCSSLPLLVTVMEIIAQHPSNTSTHQTKQDLPRIHPSACPTPPCHIAFLSPQTWPQAPRSTLLYVRSYGLRACGRLRRNRAFRGHRRVLCDGGSV